jgi:ABC-2 type transport system permease protein
MDAVLTLSWIELKLFLRVPITVVFTLALPPLVLYVLAEVFGNTPAPDEFVFRGFGAVDYYVPAYIGLVVASLGLIGLPVHLASYRERGVLRRFQAARHERLELGALSFPEATDFFPPLEFGDVGPQRHVKLAAAAKDVLNVPVIASINGITPGGWVEYAQLMVESGADAIELNLYSVAADP